MTFLNKNFSVLSLHFLFLPLTVMFYSIGTSQVFFTEDFESGVPGSCYYTYGGQPLSANASLNTCGSAPYSGSTSAVYNDSNVSSSGITFLNTPSFNTANDHIYFKLDYINCGNQGFSMYCYSSSFGFPYSTSWKSAQYKLDNVPGFTGVSNPNLRIRFIGGSGGAVGIDNIVVERPSCLPPDQIAIQKDSITASTALIAWNNDNTAGTIEIEYGPTGFIQGSGSKTYVSFPLSSHHLSGLSPNTTYDVIIRAICSPGDTSYAYYANSIKKTFKTDCNPISSLPWLEDFESYTHYTTLGCWKHQAPSWAAYSYGSTPLGQYLAASYNDAHNGRRIITPGFHLVGGTSYDLSFDYCYGYSGHMDTNYSMRVYVGNNDIASTINTLLDTVKLTTSCASSVLNKNIVFTPASSGEYYFGFASYRNIPYTSSYPTQKPIIDNIRLALSGTTNISPLNNSEYNVYPNPFENQFSISSKNGTLNNSSYFEMFDSRGKMIEYGKLNKATANVDMSHYKKGVYMITIHSKGMVNTYKLIKSN